MSENLSSSDAKRVFYLSTPKQLFMKFDWELENLSRTISEQTREYKSHEIAAYHAFNVAITAWRLSDWTWNSLSEDSKARVASECGFRLIGNKITDLKSFQTSLIKKSRALAVCWDIGSGSKHFDHHKDSKVDVKVEFEVKQARAGEFRVGQPLQSFAYDFFVHWNGDVFRAVDIFDEARNFWMQFLAKEKLIGEIFLSVQFDIKKVRLP